MRRRQSTKTKLLVARAQLRAFRQVIAAVGTTPQGTYSGAGEERFVLGWAASRGGAMVTQCLDETGQVWERRMVFGEAPEGTKERPVLEDYWFKVGMERR